jgi:hypothetical protein
MTTVSVHAENENENNKTPVNNTNSLITREKYKDICIKELKELELCKKEKNIKECDLLENLYSGCINFKNKKT